MYCTTRFWDEVYIKVMQDFCHEQCEQNPGLCTGHLQAMINIADAGRLGEGEEGSFPVLRAGVLRLQFVAGFALLMIQILHGPVYTLLPYFLGFWYIIENMPDFYHIIVGASHSLFTTSSHLRKSCVRWSRG